MTFGGTQLRNCSFSSGSPYSSTSESCFPRQCNAFPARQTGSSSLSQVEDFQRSSFSQSHSKNTRNDTDRVILDKCKKAKLVREVSVLDESPFVLSASKHSQSFASLQQSITDTDADEYHFWSKRSSPQHNLSFVRLDEDDIESPLTRTDEVRSSGFKSPFLKTYEHASSWQDNSHHEKHRHRSDNDYLQHSGGVQHQINMNLCGDGTSVSKECVPASSLQSFIRRQELATCIPDNTEGRRSEDAANLAKCDKWWAFVNGIMSESFLPG